MTSKVKLTILILPLLLSSCNFGIGDFSKPAHSSTSRSPMGPRLTSGLSFTHFKTEGVLYNNERKTIRENSLISDNYFRNGIMLRNSDTRDAYYVRCLDYGGKRDTSFRSKDPYGIKDYSCYWELGPWWAPEPSNFHTTECVEGDGKYIYENQTRLISVNPNNGELTMRVNAKDEHMIRFNSPYLPSGESWAHSLLQTYFETVYPLTLNELHVSFNIKFDRLDYVGPTIFPLEGECAQFLFYFAIGFQNKEGKNRYLWYGIPVYDSRYSNVPFFCHSDIGFVGSTGAMIYSMPSSLYMGQEQPQVGKLYQIDVDILNVKDYGLKDVLKYAVENGYIDSIKEETVHFNYFNVGWEIPGAFDVSSTIQYLDVYYK